MNKRYERLSEGRVWAYLALASVAGAAFLFLGNRWIPPLAQALLAYPILWLDLRANRPWRGAAHMLGWALGFSVLVIALTALVPSRIEPSVLRGAAYRDEMFTWIRTGVGAEGTPRLFLPEHARHYAMTLVLSLATAGFAGLALGCVLLNYMNFYVGSLVAQAAHPGLAALVGWPIWPIVRVVGFVLGAIAAAQFAVLTVEKRRLTLTREVRRMFLWSVALVVADVLLKVILAHPWRQLLARAF